MAKDFNTSIGDVNTGGNSVFASRGVSPLSVRETANRPSTVVDTSARTKGTSDLLSMGLEAFNAGVGFADDRIKQTIDNEAQAEFDAAANEIAQVDARSVLEQSISYNEPVPSEINEAVNTLQRNKNARDQGALSEDGYWARMHSVSRQLRARFPGHRDYIDQKVAQISGGRPANELVSNMLRQQAAQATASAKAEASRSALRERMVFNGINVPDGMSETEMLDYAGPILAERERAKQLKASFELRKAQGEIVDSLEVDSAKHAVRSYMLETFNNVLTPIGKTYQEFQTKLTNAQADGTIDEKEQTAIRTAFANLRLSATNLVETELLSNYPTMKDTDRRDVMAPMLRRIDEMERALINGETGVLMMKKIEFDAMRRGDDIEFLESDPVLRAASAAERNLGQVAGQVLVNGSAKFRETLDQALYGYAHQKLNADPDRGVLREIREYRGSDRPTFTRAILDDRVRLLLDDKATPDEVDRAARALFGVNNGSLLDIIKEDTTSVDPLGNKARVFSTLANENVYKKLKTLADSGNSGPLERYKTWTKEAFASIYRSKADTLASTVGGGYEYDEKAGLFRAVEVVPNADTPVERRRNAQNRVPVQVINDLNIGLKGLSRVLEEDGLTATEYLETAYPVLMEKAKRVNQPLTGRANLGGPTETPTLKSAPAERPIANSRLLALAESAKGVDTATTLPTLETQIKNDEANLANAFIQLQILLSQGGDPGIAQSAIEAYTQQAASLDISIMERDARLEDPKNWEKIFRNKLARKIAVDKAFQLDKAEREAGPNILSRNIMQDT